MQELYIGLMSGTSLDAVDAVVVDFDKGFKVLGHESLPFESAFKADLLRLQAPAADELHRAYLASNTLALYYTKACQQLLNRLTLSASDIKAIGAHGQTVRHRPGAYDSIGYTVQLNNPSLLAERLGITVCADFRARDIAAGGQGAPLVPAFHMSLFRADKNSVCVVNLGGISNLSVIPAKIETPGLSVDQPELIGFDCGPANCLMDEWCRKHTGQDFDESGRWAASGSVVEPLLELLMQEDYFNAPHPKSTGRDLFNMQWLDKSLDKLERLKTKEGTTRPVDIQATLAALTAKSCAQSIERVAPFCAELIVCGGGALNVHLMRLLALYLPSMKVVSSQLRGLPPLQVEAAAFAWLAKQCMNGETASVRSVTGAQGARILGAIYQA